MPIFTLPPLIYTFTQGKEFLFKTVVIASILALLLAGIRKGFFNFKKILLSPICIVFLVLVGLSVLADALSLNPIVAFYGTYSRGFGLLTQLFIFAFVFYCANTVKEKDALKFLKYAFAGGVIVALYALVQKTGFDPFFGYYDKDIFAGRVFSFLGNPGYLGQLMALDLIIGVFLIISEKRNFARVFYGLGSAIAFLAMAFSETRIAFVALVVCCLLVAVRSRKQIAGFVKKLKFKHFLISAAIIAAIAGTVILALPKDRFSLSDAAFRSLSSRVEIWKGAFNLILKRPWLGYGEETYYIYFPETVTKEFLTLEENINLSADRIHNEMLETLYSYGVFAGLAYLVFIALLLWNFIKTRDNLAALLLLVVIANIIQNQFSFSDITIRALTAFCLGAFIALQIKDRKPYTVKIGRILKPFLAITGIALSAGLIYVTIYIPLLSHLAYTVSHRNYAVSYEIAVNEHKKAAFLTPYYSELWYELMFIDPSSMPRALGYLEQIEGDSGNVLAWKGNYYSTFDPEKATEYYMRALEKNPYYPNWIRAFADMLYKYGDYESALFLYDKYFIAAPDFWKWKDTLEERTSKDKTSYRVFFKNVPYFWGVVDKYEQLRVAFPEQS